MSEPKITIAGAGWVTTVAKLSRGMEVSERMVRKLLVDPRWPFGEHGPWNTTLCSKWHRTELQRNDPQIMRLIAVARLRKLSAEVARLQGEVVNKQFHTECLTRLAEIFVRALEMLEQALPLVLARKSEGEIADMLADRFDRIRTQIATGKALQLGRGDGNARRRSKPGRPLANRAR